MSVEIESLAPLKRSLTVPEVETPASVYASLKEAHGTKRSVAKGCECVECRGVRLR